MTRPIQPGLLPGVAAVTVARAGAARTVFEQRPGAPAPPDRSTIHDPSQIDIEEALRAKPKRKRRRKNA